MKGLLITLEGPDGAGKTSQLQNIAEILVEQGYTVITTREPGGTSVGTAIRNLLLNPEHGKMTDKAEVLLYAADRAQHVQELILPALSRGDAVVCDRYIDSTLAYQGYGRNLDLEFLERVNSIATGGLKPDLTLILDVPSEVGLGRIINGRLNGAGVDRIEGQALEFHQRVRAGYLAIAAKEPERCRIIDASGQIEQVRQAVALAVKDFLQVRVGTVWGKNNENQ
ncbi:MAG: dTMP kinase [Clostridia bacterium]|nr:dTMP kinase [Clostridia bacterium]